MKIQWDVKVSFSDRDEAIAFMDLVAELGVTCSLHQFQVNEGESRNWSTRLTRAILKAMEPNKTYTSEDFMIICEENEFSKNSWSPAVVSLEKAGMVVRISRGLYRKARDKDKAKAE